MRTPGSAGVALGLCLALALAVLAGPTARAAPPPISLPARAPGGEVPYFIPVGDHDLVAGTIINYSFTTTPIGLAVNFSLHVHVGTEVYVLINGLRAPDHVGTFTVAQAGSYLLVFSNPNAQPIQVAYDYSTTAPPSAPPSPLVYVAAAALVTIFVGVAVLLVWPTLRRSHD